MALLYQLSYTYYKPFIIYYPNNAQKKPASNQIQVLLSPISPPKPIKPLLSFHQDLRNSGLLHWNPQVEQYLVNRAQSALYLLQCRRSFLLTASSQFDDWA